MKTCLIIALLFVSSVGFAQSGSKVLLVSQGGRLAAAVHEIIPNSYDSAGELPSDIHNYHTLLIAHGLVGARLDLLEFAKAGGQIYLEAPLREHDTAFAFWDSIGLHRVVYTAGEFYCDSAYGFYGYKYSEPMSNLNLVGYMGHIGELEPVLYLCGEPEAWVPANKQLKILMQNYPQGPDYYESFMRVALCSYFGLCPAAVLVRAVTHTRIRTRYTQGWLKAELPESVEGTIRVFNLTGSEVLSGRVSSKISIYLPLSPGLYFVTVTSHEQSFASSFFIAQ